ncbi:hypothetical protein ACR78Z_10655 [Sphingobacterium thalpophilum]|uniref:Lipoprotein n=1 Tax=Sphingobacterium thalpophilum TaxID=259 RepID=A0A4U9VE60_9SPHI|nr:MULTISPECIES: hypothetical protein [Sphingobacterium]MCW8312763.1 hypothetical protein [Sphingobacterium sp. InxBP1]VTR41281.1 Uncharacterised protein [Sphingobacterium thalpophilum]
MKNRSIKSGVKTGILAIAFLSFAVGCSKDDDNVPKPVEDIQAAIGTFKGTIHVAGRDYYNAIVMVTKEGDDLVKVAAKSGELYSAVTPKVFKVQNISNIHISYSGGPSGSFTYLLDTKSLVVSTEKEAAADVSFNFEGTKQ